MALNEGYAYTEQVGPEARGLTVAEHLARTHRHSSGDEWRARADRGEVTIDGARARADDVLRSGQVLTWRRPAWDEPEVPRDIAFLYEDDDLVAVSKPSGLPTMPAGGFLRHTLHTLVRERIPGATALHRLGRDTSGVVLFAKTDLARERLHAAWRRHEVQKHYRALGAGTCASDTVEVTAPIGPVPHDVLGSVHAATPDGKASRSFARVLERREGATLFEVEIATGRPHQIRIHLAHAGFPLLGDPLYVAGGLPGPGTRALPGDGGYLLHAARLRFSHPLRKSDLEIIAPAPEPLRTAAERAAGRECARAESSG